MINLKNVEAKDVGLDAIVAAATAEGNYESDRMFVLDGWMVERTNPMNGVEVIVLEGGHCSCYDYDEVEWTATGYTKDEFKKVIEKWATGTLLERQMYAALEGSQYRGG